MDAIEIFFAVYGVLLALAAAKLLSAIVRLVRRRDTIRIGWTTPLLMLLLLLDLCSFVNNASQLMGSADLNLAVVTTGVLSSGVYYLAASFVTPEDFADWPDLDVYYERHKHFVIGGMLIASLLGFELTSLLVKGLAATITERWTGLQAALVLAYYLLIGVLLFIRDRAINIVMLGTLSAIYCVVIATA